jgi:electron transfer flavoprotein alpha subunit
MHHDRAGKILSGTAADQAAEAVALLAERGALEAATPDPVVPPAGRGPAAPASSGSVGVIAVLIEPDRPQVGMELLGAASELAASLGGRVRALAFEGAAIDTLGAGGADAVTTFTGAPLAEDVAAAIVGWSAENPLWAVLGPSTAFGREVLGRMAAALGAGMFSGALVADIFCTSDVRLVTVRPGVLPLVPPREHTPDVSSWPITPRSRVRVVSQRRDDDVEVLARAEAVIGVGAALRPDDYEELSPLASLLGAELAATRKVTDKGWAPRARQVGITGRSIAPRLYVALGLSGKFNHMVGVRAAGTILAVNEDPGAPVFSQCDIGIVGDWHVVVPALAAALRQELHRR